MKKLYRKGAVHPSSPPSTVSEQLSFLPAKIFTLIVALSPEDKEVLAYLISCSSSSCSFFKNPNRKTKDAVQVQVEGEHLPLFHCNCFHCYMSYWIRWNSSPNHQLIHTIIDDFEDFLSQTANKRKQKKNRKASNKKNYKPSELNRSELESLEQVTESNTSSDVVDVSEEIHFVDSVEVEDEHEEKLGSVKKLMSFIGVKVWFRWCVWGRWGR